MNLATNLPNPEATFQTLTSILQHVEVPEKKEQRITVRKQILCPIRIQPCDNEMNPLGESFEGLSRDVSVSGVGFFSTERIDAPHVSITFKSLDASGADTIFAEVVHQSSRGPIFVIGSKVLVDWEA